MADPFTLIALGLGTAGSLAGGIYDAVTADDRKKAFLKEQYDLMRRQAMRGQRDLGGGELFPTNDIDTAYNIRDVRKAAEENFKVNPMSFLPFVQQGTQFAGAVHGAATKGSQPAQRAPVNSVLMQMQEAQRRQDEMERAEAASFFNQKYGRGNW